jgi:hypothetical protein
VDLTDEGKYSEPITALQLLENRLTEFARNKAPQREVLNTRYALMSHFDDREMIILSQPSKSEKDLRNLDKVDPKRLTHEFNDDREMLMEYIFEMPKGKALQQKKLTVDCLVHLLEEALNGLNKDDNIDFARIWSDYIKDQAENAVLDATTKLDEDIEDL